MPKLVSQDNIHKIIRLADALRARLKEEIEPEHHSLVDDLVDIGQQIVLNLVATER